MEEWETAFYAYRAAQARLATAGAYLSLLSWEQTVQPLGVAGTAADWAAYTTRVVRALRRRQQMLAQAYLQYIRAYDIQESLGETVTGAGGDDLDSYRQILLDGIQDAATMGTDDTASAWPEDADWDFITSELRQVDPNGASSNARAARFTDVDLDRHIQEYLDTWGENRPVTKAPFNWPPLQDDSHDQAHRSMFVDLAERAARDLKDEAKKRDTARETEADRETLQQEAAEDFKVKGNRIAGQVMGATSHAADQVTNWVLRSDRKIRAVARGTSATPCAFCAMLASRGFAYSSVQTAMTTRGGTSDVNDTSFKRYHPNCQCYPIVRYIDAAEVPTLNKKFRQMWNTAAGQPGDPLNNLRLALYKENNEAINQRRRQLYYDRKSRREWEAAGR